jgi:hypothetical protein
MWECVGVISRLTPAPFDELLRRWNTLTALKREIHVTVTSAAVSALPEKKNYPLQIPVSVTE